MADCPGRLFRPKKYWVPSASVTFQYSPSLSPLLSPVSFSIFEPSSDLACQPLPVWKTSSEPFPLSERVALSERQHSSPVSLEFVAPFLVSSLQLT
ncbi:hypothetical protein ACFQ0D_02380 [Micromonospora zhanjiangensis]